MRKRTDGLPKILVVDDDADWREYLCTCLGELGYQTQQACDGHEAMTLLAGDHGCEIILLDLHMPGMDGEQVLQHLPPDAPRVVFVTSARAEEVGPLRSGAAHYYLPKGASPAALSLMLHALQP